MVGYGQFEVDETKLMFWDRGSSSRFLGSGQLAGIGVKPSGVRYFAMGRAKS